MSRKDFEQLAAIIAGQDLIADAIKVHLVTDLADWLETTNPRFDRKRFIAAAMEVN